MISLLEPILNASRCHSAKNRAAEELRLMKLLKGVDSKQSPGTESCIRYGGREAM